MKFQLEFVILNKYIVNLPEIDFFFTENKCPRNFSQVTFFFLIFFKGHI